MALPTKAQWADNFNALTTMNNLGELLADQAHIMRAFLPTIHPRSTVKVNWTDGAGAGQVAVGAGSAQSASAAPAQVNDTFTKEFAAYGSQAVNVFGTQMQTVGFEEELSQQSAMRSIYTKWVDNLIGSGTGTNNAMWGFENFITVAATAGSTMSLTSTTADAMLTSIDQAVTSLPPSGFNIALTDNEGYNEVKALIRALGGVASNEVKSEAFGSNVLEFSGVSFFNTERMTALGTSPSIDVQVDFFNIGPEGCQMIVPEGGPFLVQGPKQTKGEFDEVFDIALRSQILYKTSRAAFKLIQRL